jgi:hypothetical protein
MVKKEIDETENEIVEIDDLPGVGPMTADKLKDAGYDTVMSIAVAPTSELSEASGMSAASATKAQIAARNAMDMGFITGAEAALIPLASESSEVGATAIDITVSYPASFNLSAVIGPTPGRSSISTISFSVSSISFLTII